MNHPVSERITARLPDDKRQQVLTLRRSHSLGQVATMTGLPLGTVKTLCSRSGAFRDNPEHRAMFTLPPIRVSTATEVAVVELPEQRTVTGDKEVDAVLWLHEVIKTGQADLIEKAKVAAARIKTPLADLEKRYTQILRAANPGNVFATFSSMGFADLDAKAARAVERKAREQEAIARFGDDIFVDTPAEVFCREKLEGIQVDVLPWERDAKQVDSAFATAPKLLPNTLSDCVHEIQYWSDLYWLRAAFENSGDHHPEVDAREDMLFRLLAKIRPRSPQEAVSVFRFMAEGDRLGRTGAEDVLLNLIGGAK